MRVLGAATLGFLAGAVLVGVIVLTGPEPERQVEIIRLAAPASTPAPQPCHEELGRALLYVSDDLRTQRDMVRNYRRDPPMRAYYRELLQRAEAVREVLRSSCDGADAVAIPWDASLFSWMGLGEPEEECEPADVIGSPDPLAVPDCV